MLRDLVLKTRSYRRFNQTKMIKIEELMELIDLARLSASGANLQPLKYIISNETEKNAMIFKHLRWAGYLPEWSGPVDGEQPSAYIVILHDKSISKTPFWDHGIACQSIMLGATEKGYGGCIFASFDKAGLRNDLKIDDNFEILMVLALGEPVEKVVIEELEKCEDIKYFRDSEQVHHVPKRSLESLIIK